MNKITKILLSFLMTFSLVGCRQETSTSEPDVSAQAETTENKTLVVYYSATGNTEQVANYIAEITNGDLFELEPVDDYTSDDLRWTDENSRVVQEYENPNQRNIELVSTTVDGFEDYDTIFIGYPIWWQIAAWPVNEFIENNDFTGKTVVPFCTSSSSGIGESGQLLEEMAGTGEWLDGERFQSNASKEDVQSWIDQLNL